VFVVHLQRPLLVGAEVAVDVLEYLAGHQRGLVPGGFVVLKFLADVITAGAHAVGMEKVSGHVTQMPKLYLSSRAELLRPPHLSGEKVRL
jgi:hypothetical protein